MLGERARPRAQIQRLVAGPHRDAEPAAGVHLTDRAAGALQRPRHRRHPPQRLLDVGQSRREVAVAHVDVDRVEDQVVAAGDLERARELLGEDAELRRPGAGVLRPAAALVGSAGPGVDAHADRRTGGPPSRPARSCDSRSRFRWTFAVEQDVQISFGDVRARVGDLRGVPAVRQGVGDLARRARVDPHPRASLAQEPEHRRIALGLERQAHAGVETRILHRVAQGDGLLLDPPQVVDEQRRAVPPGEPLGIAAGDAQAAVVDVQTRACPPRRSRSPARWQSLPGDAQTLAAAASSASISASVFITSCNERIPAATPTAPPSIET